MPQDSILEFVRVAIADRSYIVREELMNIVFHQLDAALQTLVDAGEISIRPGPDGEPHLDLIACRTVYLEEPLPRL